MSDTYYLKCKEDKQHSFTNEDSEYCDNGCGEKESVFTIKKLMQENKIMREALKSIACATLDFSDLPEDYYRLQEVIINDTLIAREALEKVSK